MTPAEVIAMRDQVAQVIKNTLNVRGVDDRVVLAVAESLIKSGWVVAPPKSEGESE